MNNPKYCPFSCDTDGHRHVCDETCALFNSYHQQCYFLTLIFAQLFPPMKITTQSITPPPPAPFTIPDYTPYPSSYHQFPPSSNFNYGTGVEELERKIHINNEISGLRDCDDIL